MVSALCVIVVHGLLYLCVYAYMCRQHVGRSITICMSLADIAPFLSCELRLNRLNSLRACNTACHASCTDRARKVTVSDPVVLSFTGSDVAACQCGEQGDRNVAMLF